MTSLAWCSDFFWSAFCWTKRRVLSASAFTAEKPPSGVQSPLITESRTTYKKAWPNDLFGYAHNTCSTYRMACWICRPKNSIILLLVSVFIFFLYLLSGSGVFERFEGLRLDSSRDVTLFAQPRSSQGSPDFGPGPKKLERKLVLALKYWEQLTMATNNLLHLARLSDQWGAAAVVPFTRNSRLFGLPTRQMRSLDLVFNMRQLRELFSAKNITPLVPFDEFISTASRNVIFVSLYYGRTISTKQLMKCHRNAKKLAIAPLNKEAQKRNLSRFYVEDCCSFKGMLPTTPEQISTVCGLTDKKSYTVVVQNWRGFLCAPGQQRLIIPSLCRQGKHLINGTTGSYPHSQFVKGNASLFVQDWIGLEPYVGIHIRGDSLIVRNKSIPAIIPKCFRQLYSLLSTLSFKYSILFGDKKVSTIFGAYLRKYKLRHDHFDPEFFGAVKDTGFVAQVESVILSKADILVIVGGGSFASQIMARFKREDNSRTIYLICVSDLPTNHIIKRKV